MATSIPPVSDGQVIEIAWGNQVRTEVSNLEAQKVSKAGSTMTGALLLPASSLLTAANAAQRKDYIDKIRTDSLPKAGGTMTGTLNIDTTTTNVIYAHNSTNTPRIAFGHDTTAELLGFFGATLTALQVYSDNALYFYSDAVYRFGQVGSALLFGKTVSDPNQDGAEIYGGGSAVQGRISLTAATESVYAQLVLRHVSGADKSGEYYIIFQRSTLGTTAGYIAQGAGNTIIIGGDTTSAATDVVGDVVDPIAAIRKLIPRRLRWKEDGTEFVGFRTEDVVEVAPYACLPERESPGDALSGTARIPAVHDPSKLVPLLVAAIQHLATRLEALEEEALA